MNPIQALRNGIRILGGTKRMWFVFWFYNVALSLVVVLPLSAVLASDLGHSAYARQMMKNFDIQWFSEFFVKSSGWPIVLFTPLALVVAASYFLLSTFLYGGALTVIGSPERRYRPGLFYQGCGRNFGRLFRLVLFSAVFYAIALIVNSVLQGVAQAIWSGGMEARPIVIFGWFRLAFLALLLLLVNMVFDYAKIRMVVDDSGKAVRAGLGSFVLVARNFGRCGGTYALVALLAIAFYAVYAAISGPVPRVSVWGVLLFVLIQQAYVVSRIWVKLLFLSSQTEIYTSVKAEEEPEPALAQATGDPVANEPAGATRFDEPGSLPEGTGIVSPEAEQPVPASGQEPAEPLAGEPAGTILSEDPAPAQSNRPRE